ncbi:MAG: hypothetical protein ACT4P5_19370 [Armatimonadota bacterium]
MTDYRTELLGEYLTRLQVLNYSPLTIRDYRLAVEKLQRTYPEIPLERFTPKHIEHHIYVRSVGPRTKATEIERLRSFFTYLAAQKRLMRRNPCDDVECPRFQEPHRPAVSFKEFES